MPRENYKLFFGQIYIVRKGVLFMKSKIVRDLSDKHNDNVICYVGSEVVLCR